MKPAHAEFTKNLFPIEIAGLELAGGGVSAIWHANRAANAETALRKIQSITYGAPDAVIGFPENEVGGDPALHDEIFDEVADFIVHERRAHRRLQPKTFAQSACNVVFAAPLPNLEFTGRTDTPFAGVEAEHDFPERKLAKCAFVAEFEWHDVSFSDSRSRKRGKIPRFRAAFVGDFVEGFDFSFGEEKPAMFLRQRCGLRFGLTGEHALLVTMTQDVMDNRLHILSLVATLGECAAAHCVGMNALEEECRCMLLIVLLSVVATDRRQ